MSFIIELLEKMYNFTYVSTDESGVHLFTCNGCGREYRIQIIAPASSEPPARQPVPAAFYKAFENEE